MTTRSNKKRINLAKFLVGLMMLIVMTPDRVWCHEDDGNIAIEFGTNWGSIPVSGSEAGEGSCCGSTARRCASCVDIPASVIQARDDASILAITLIHWFASLESSVPTNDFQDPFLPFTGNPTQNRHEIYLLLLTINSTILLI